VDVPEGDAGTPRPFHPRAYLAGRLAPTLVYPRGNPAGGKEKVEVETYLRKLVHAASVLVAYEARAHVSSDDLEFAYIFMKNHLAILRRDLQDLLDE